MSNNAVDRIQSALAHYLSTGEGISSHDAQYLLDCQLLDPSTDQEGGEYSIKGTEFYTCVYKKKDHVIILQHHAVNNNCPFQLPVVGKLGRRPLTDTGPVDTALQGKPGPKPQGETYPGPEVCSRATWFRRAKAKRETE